MAAAECEKRPDASEDGYEWEFAEGEIRWINSAEKKSGTMEWTMDETRSPMHVDWWIDGERGSKWHVRGIARVDGGSLQICARIGTPDDPPVRPTDFATQKGDDALKLILYTRVDK